MLINDCRLAGLCLYNSLLLYLIRLIINKLNVFVIFFCLFAKIKNNFRTGNENNRKS